MGGQKAMEMKNETITAEHEFNRIIQLLQQPMITEVMPQATMAPIPQLGNSPQNMNGYRSPTGMKPASMPVTRTNFQPAVGPGSPVRVGSQPGVMRGQLM